MSGPVLRRVCWPALVLCGLSWSLPAVRGQEEAEIERTAEVLALEDLRVTDPGPWKRLLDATRDDPPGFARVVRGIGRVAGTSLVPLIAELLEPAPSRSSPEVREALALAVGLLGEPALLAPLAKVAPGAPLAFALGLVGRLPEDAAAADLVRAALPLGESARDEAAIRALLLYGSRVEGLDLSDVALREIGKGPSYAALHYFARRKQPPAAGAGPKIAAHLLAEDGEVAALAAKALARTEGAGRDEAVLLAAASAAGGARAARIERLRGLALLPPGEGRGAVVAALKDRDPHLRRTALETARAFAVRADAEDRRGLGLFALAIANDDPVPDVRRAAVLALASLEPRTFVKLLPEWRLVDPWPVRAAAAEAAVAHCVGGGEPALSEGAVQKVFDDPDRRVVLAAAEALRDRVEAEPAAAGAASPAVVRAGGLARKAFLRAGAGTGAANWAFRTADPVLLGVLARIVTALSTRAGLAGWPPAAELLPRLAAAVPGTELEAWQAILDLAGANESGEAILIEAAKGDEVALARQASALLVARGCALPARAAVSSAAIEERARALRPLAAELRSALPSWAKITTDRGTITVRFDVATAPLTVASFRRLAKDGFFDGVLWHRVVPGFVAQAGCPRGDGWGGTSTIRCEISTRHYGRGTLGMALAGKDTGSSQWFLTHVATPHLDGRFTIFGEVESGLEVLDALVPGDAIRSVLIEP